MSMFEDPVLDGAHQLFDKTIESLDSPMKERYQAMFDWYNKSSLLEFVVSAGTKINGVMLTDKQHNPVPLEEVVKTGPAVILFFRGEWCGFCNYYVRTLSESMSIFKDGGARFYAITPDTCFTQREWLEISETDFHIVSDPDFNIARQFGLVYEVPDAINDVMLELGVDLMKRNGNRNLPLTGVFVVDERCEVAWKDVGQDFRYRTTPEEILAAISGDG